MKLVNKTFVYYAGYSLFVFIIGTVFFYFSIRKVLFDGIDEALHQEKIQVIENLKYENDFTELHQEPFIYISKLKQPASIYDHYSIVQNINPSTHLLEDFRQLKSVYIHGNDTYQIIIKQPLAEVETLIASILPIELLLFAGLIIGLLFINRYVNNIIWRPFYNILDQLKSYDITRGEVISYYPSTTNEFDELSNSLDKMTSKLHQDFMSQKEFHENSSHELQTPLAIIRNKLEMLIQSPHLKGEDMELIEAIFRSLNRLTHLNQGLLLLSKIDNHVYSEQKFITLSTCINHIIDGFAEKIKMKNIQCIIEVDEDDYIKTNPFLFETLLINLISNAIKYNVEKGTIKIIIDKTQLEIINTGNEEQLDTNKMFERFQKSSNDLHSVGLGLSIVKKICNYLHYEINYSQHSNMHSVLVIYENNR
jgi:signal transduction histidine kinase